MAVAIRNAHEIELMRESNRLLELVHEKLAQIIAPGISTLEIDQAAEAEIRALGGVPNFLNYEGYPASICVSVNDEVVHGIPRADRILQEGDIVSLDCGLIWKGYHSDAARTYGVGKISAEAQHLIDVTEESFFKGMEMAVAGNHLNDISKAIGDYAAAQGCGVVRDLCGHGIGKAMHEDPMIMNFEQPRKGIRLVAGMTLAVEPMLTNGTWKIDWLDDGWTAVTRDGSLAAHYENTILITEGAPEILSLTKGRKHGA